MIKGEFIIKAIPILNDSGGNIEKARVLTFSDGVLSKATGDSVFHIGVSLPNTIYGENGETPNGQVVDVAIAGVVKILASSAITKGSLVYAGNDGTISSSGTLPVGVAMEDGSEGDEVLVLLK